MTILLSLLLASALSIGTWVILLVLHRAWHNPKELHACPGVQVCSLLWPGCWMVIKSRNCFLTQLALGLHHPKPCSGLEGLAGGAPLFIAPPIRGWILVTGTGLPDPCEDADVCFRFIRELSRKVGKVQCFSASQGLHHHAWVKAKDGRIVRAYAWAGQTLWNQGPKTRAEKELGLTCYDYTEPTREDGLGQVEGVAANVAKVPLLAARWSLAPSRIYEQLLQKNCGIAGEPARQ